MDEVEKIISKVVKEVLGANPNLAEEESDELYQRQQKFYQESLDGDITEIKHRLSRLSEAIDKGEFKTYDDLYKLTEYEIGFWTRI